MLTYYRRILAFAFLISHLLPTHTCFAQLTEHKSLSKISSDQEDENSGKDYISFYQNYISGIRGNNCPMYPSCSNYALLAIQNKGLVQGMVSGMDRLMRCGHEPQYYPITFSGNIVKSLDFSNRKLNDEYAYVRTSLFYPYSISETDTCLSLVSELILDKMFREAFVEIKKEKKRKGLLSNDLIAYELLCYNAINEHEKVIYEYEARLPNEIKNDVRIKKQYFLAYYKLGNYSRIASIASESKYAVNLPNYCKDLVFLSYLKLGQVDFAADFLQNSHNLSAHRNNQEAIISGIKNYKPKSPFIAGLSSAMLPGSGYAYSKHFKTGISALVINSLFAFATYSSFKTKNTGTGLLFGITGLAFYISNIQGSVKSARRYNEHSINSKISPFENRITSNP